MTKTGTIVGSLPYMAPEQLFGEADDARTDIYALGVMLFEMVTGQRPFVKARPEALMFAIINNAAPSARSLRADVPAELDRLLAECLAKDPTQRPESAAAFAEALRLPEGETPAHLTAAAASAVAPVVAGIGGLLTPDPQGATALIPMSPVTPVTPAIPAATVTIFDTARRRRRMLIGGAAGLAALVLVLVIAFASVGQAKADTSPAPQATHTPTAPTRAATTAATTAAPRPSATTALPVNAATAKAPAAPAPAPAPAPALKAVHTHGKGHGGGKKK
jgi:serine/threonine-protein kinase